MYIKTYLNNKKPILLDACGHYEHTLNQTKIFQS